MLEELTRRKWLRGGGGHTRPGSAHHTGDRFKPHPQLQVGVTPLLTGCTMAYRGGRNTARWCL